MPLRSTFVVDMEVKEPRLLCLRHKEVKSDVNLSSLETKTW